MHTPLFAVSLNGSMCVDSMIPGRPSTTPAVWLKLRCAWRSPSKLGPAPAPRDAVVGSSTKLLRIGLAWFDELVGFAEPG